MLSSAITGGARKPSGPVNISSSPLVVIQFGVGYQIELITLASLLTPPEVTEA